MLRLREYLATKNGTIISGVVAVVAVLGVCYFVWQTFAPSAAVAEANSRWFVDSTNGKPFRLKPVLGQTLPVKAPSGGMTGYPAELCYWNADGTVREEPTYVLLNSWLGKPEPTFCPDCGRLVVGHNPVPTEGAKPPPTREEYNNRRHH